MLNDFVVCDRAVHCRKQVVGVIMIASSLWYIDEHLERAKQEWMRSFYETLRRWVTVWR